MLKKSFFKFLFLFLIISFLGFGQFVLACAGGQTRDGDPCGTQTCDQDCEEKIIDTGIEIFIFTVCDWGSCESDGETQDCGTCGVQECQSGSTSCSWGDCDETPKPGTKRTRDLTQYRCQGDECGQEYIQKRECEETCTRTCSCIGGGEWECSSYSDCDTDCDSPELVEECGLDWQLCSGSTNWSRTSRSCNCAGTCLETPKNPRYYNNPNYPIDPYEPEESENANNVFLPVKLDWDNVKAWKNGWEEDGELKECSEDCFKSYLIEINNTATGNFSKVLTQDSEYNPTQDQGACFLKSGITHNLDVSACCNANGTNCSSKSNWSFDTKSAPEPILPADPDWKEEEIKSGVEIPVFLDWCDVNNAKSFRLKTYYIEDGEELCHPLFTSGESCDSEIIRTENRPPPYYDPTKNILYSDFQDNGRLFTKETEYRWQLSTCFYENGVNCGDFGQKWGFDTASVSFPDLQLESPFDDPSGERAVGFPVILEWKQKPGMNSFIYDVYETSPGELTGNVNLSQKVFDYPTLSLDTFYTWRVKPCWDFEALDCENWPPNQEWIFKTTGAPPELISPVDNASNIPIPIKLEYESVSGAKAYRYWLYSEEELITNGITSEDFVLIKYDPNSNQPKQDTNYSWQIATCADKEGNICGERTELQDFRTFRLLPPLNLLPENNETIFTYQMPAGFSWDSNAKYFRFILDYTERSGQETGDCPLGRKEEVMNSSFRLVSLSCLGEYQWQVQACLDENCDQEGQASIQNFTLDQTVPPAEFGLVPCGRSSDNPNTPWNERDSCQFKHLFILLKNIIDFLLWRVTLIILLLLVIATAIIFYFSMGAPALVIDVRRLWKTAGKGYAIIFLSWIIINLVLNILGYRVGIFGQWWQINF